MPANDIQAIQPWIAAGDALTIVSFDDSAEAAVRETKEERSLNLALRRRRVRSEVLRIPLEADAATKAFLTDVIAALAGRRILVLARKLQEYADARELVLHLCDVATEVLIVVVGSGADAITHPSVSIYQLEHDHREHIEMLADALIQTQPG